MTDLGPDIRIYSAAGARKPFPTYVIESVDWELTDRGYYGKCGIQIKTDFDGSLGMANGDRIDLYVDSVLRYRGYIGTLQDQLQVSERLAITAYGLAERLNGILVPGRYVAAASMDVSAFATWLYTNYISERIDPAVGLASDIQSAGVAFEPLRLDCNRASARKLLDDLADLAGGAIVWGFDVDASGQDRFFLRPKSQPVAYKFQIGGRVQAYDYPRDATAVVNAIHLSGAQAEYPNQLTNSSLESPIVCDAEHADLLVGGSLEETALWSLLNAEYNTDYACKGDSSVRITVNNGYLSQAGIPAEVGANYTLEFWHWTKLAAEYHIEVIPNVGSTIRFPTSGTYTSPAAGTDGPFSCQVCQFAGPAGASGVTVKIVGDAVSGVGMDALFIDEISLRKDGTIAEDNWFLDRRAVDADIAVDWASTDAYHGGLAAHVTGSLSGAETVRIHQPRHRGLNVQESRRYQLTFWAKSNVGDVDVTPFILARTTDKTQETYEGTPATVGSTWTRVVFSDAGFFAYSYHSSVLAGVLLNADSADGGGDVDILLDAFYWSELPGGEFIDSPYCPDYVESDKLEWDLTTDDTFVQSSDLPAAVKGSITQHGRREASESVDKINSLEMAQEWAKAYFGAHASDEAGHRIDVVDCREIVGPDGKIKLLGSTIEPAFPVKIGYKLAGNRVDMSAELNIERPSFALLLNAIAEKARVVSRL